MSELRFELERRFPGGPTIRAALELPIERPEITVLFGPSGSGKTTVLRCLAGLERPDAGFVSFGQESWFDSRTGAHRPPQQRGVGLLFQRDALFPHLTVEQNVAYGLRLGTPQERRARVQGLLERFGVQSLASRRPGTLSGGQRQRVALARALAPAPRLLLLDEPLSALDAPTRESLRAELRGLLRGAGIPAVLVTHDRLEALALGDAIAVLTDGSIRQYGPVEAVFNTPADVEVARVVGTENVLAARVVGREEDLTQLELSGQRLVAASPAGLGSTVWVCVRAEEVALERSEPSQTSVRNRLRGTVTQVLHEGPLARVHVDCGFPLVSLVTRRSVDVLGLAPGQAVIALIKAQAIRVVTR